MIGRGLGSRTQFTSRIKPAAGPEVYLRRGQGAGHQRGSSIIIEDVKYTYKDINRLPHNLSMENVKILRETDGLAVQSHHAFMSNMFVCLIKANGQVFKSAEHFY